MRRISSRRSANVRLRLIFVSSSSTFWGAEQSLLTLGRELLESGHDARLCSSSTELVTRWREAGGDAEFIEARSGPPIIRELGWYRRFLGQCDGWLDEPAALVVFSIELILLGWFARLSSGRRDLRFVLDLHDYFPTRLGRLKLRTLGSAMDHVIAVSNYVAAQMPGRRVAVLTRPVTPRQGLAVVKPDEPVIGVIGRLDPDKNIELALRSLSELPEEFRLSIRGAPSDDGEYAARCRRSGEALGAGRVEWTGRLPNEVVLEGLGILLVCNSREALGRTVLEAQLAGIPVVVPSGTGAAELVVNGVSGVVYSAGDHTSCSEGIKTAWAEREELARNALGPARKATDPAAYAQEFWLKASPAQGASRRTGI